MDKSVEMVFTAHESEVGALVLNPQGTLVATSSIKGTLIKIYSSEEGTLL